MVAFVFQDEQIPGVADLVDLGFDPKNPGGPPGGPGGAGGHPGGPGGPGFGGGGGGRGIPAGMVDTMPAHMGFIPPQVVSTEYSSTHGSQYSKAQSTRDATRNAMQANGTC